MRDAWPVAAKFIENFTKSDLTWFRRSMVPEPVRPALSRHRVTVTEVTGDTFQQVVMREDVVRERVNPHRTKLVLGDRISDVCV